MEWSCKPFAELTNDELYDLLQLRGQVFVVEQKAAYLDCDGRDKAAYHLMLKDAGQQLIACARLLPPGQLYPEAAIGRVVVRPDQRGHGLAHELMRQAIPRCFSLFGGESIHISAQKHLQGFYSQHGFRPVTETYLEDGIPHVGMLYEKKPAAADPAESADMVIAIDPAAAHTAAGPAACSAAANPPSADFRLYYLGHSAWLVRTSRRWLLFDYGRLPIRPSRGGLERGALDLALLDPLPIYAFASHKHADHYSAELQRRLSRHPQANYVLGLDAPPTAADSAAAPRGTWLVWPHSQLRLDDLCIRTTASTDSGVSFLVEAPEGVFYHGGDLAVWDDLDQYRQGYRREIDLLADWLAESGRQPDLAFLPVSTSDGYQEDALLQGIWYAEERLRPRVTVPMHAHGFENLYRRFVELAGAAGYSNILLPEKPGDVFTVPAAPDIV